MRLYSKRTERLYLNAYERHLFEEAAQHQKPEIRLLCLILLYTGCRISEALAIRNCDFQQSPSVISIKSLKKREKHHVREIPIPEALSRLVEEDFKDMDPYMRLLTISRATAWRKVSAIMCDLGIVGPQATPKGLRHSFGVHCAFCNIAMPLCQKWMGHSDIKTTAIYYQIVGREEIEMAKRMWTSYEDTPKPKHLCRCNSKP